MPTTFTARYEEWAFCLCVEGDMATECPCFINRECSCAVDYDHNGQLLADGSPKMWHCGCRICPNITANGMYVNPHNLTGAFSGQTTAQVFPVDWHQSNEDHREGLPCICGEQDGHLCTTCTDCKCKL